jgi:hypothetical protein
MKRNFAMKWLTGLIAVVAFLGGEAARGAPSPEARGDEVVAPFLDENTFAIAAVDIDRVDIAALKQWVLGSIGQAKTEAKEAARLKDQSNEPFDAMSKWVDGFKKAGGKRLYVVASLSDIPREGPFVVVPLEKGAAAEGIIDLMSPGGPRKKGEPPQAYGVQSVHAEKMGDVVVFGADSTLQRLKDAPAAQPRPEVAKAMAAAGDAPVRVALIPSDAQRQMFEAISPELPKDLGGGPSKTVSRGVQWGAVWAQLPPQTSVHLVIEGQNAANAKALQEVANNGLAWLRAHGQDVPLDVEALAKLAAPKVEGNRLVIALDTAKTRELASAVLVPSLVQARQSAERVRSMSNIRQIVLGTIMYANEHKNAWPDKLEQIALYMGGEKAFAAMMTNPVRPDQTPGYTYRKPEGQGTAQTVVVYETYTKWPGGIAVGYADGHAEWIASEQQFKRAMEEK